MPLLAPKKDLSNLKEIYGTFHVSYQGQKLEYLYNLNFRESDLKKLVDTDPDHKYIGFKKPALFPAGSRFVKWKTTLHHSLGTDARGDAETMIPISAETTAGGTHDSIFSTAGDIQFGVHQSYSPELGRYEIKVNINTYKGRGVIATGNLDTVWN